MATPDAFNPNKWFSGESKPLKTVKIKSPVEVQKKKTTATEDIDGIKSIGKIAVGGAIATMALGMAGAFGGMFKKGD